jgi:diaminopimelate decarboxylase
MISLALALVIASVLVVFGTVIDAVVVSLALTTTALGTLLPILRDAGLFEGRFGARIMAIGSVGEFAPILAIAVLLDRRLWREVTAGRRGLPPVGVLVRLNPQVEPETIAGLAVGRTSSKFGLSADEIHQLSRTGAFGAPGICLRGVHVHVGSQLSGVQAWADGARAALKIRAELREQWGDHVDTVDFGGGFPSGVTPAPSPAAFRLALDDLIATENLAVPRRLAIEPGRSIVAASGWILARVLQVRYRGGRPQAVIDAGMTELIRPALYGAMHPVHLLTARPQGELLETAVEGPVCESADTLGVHQLPALRRSDLVAIAGAGAYGSARATMYNGRPRPAEVFVHSSGDLELAQARQQVA